MGKKVGAKIEAFLLWLLLQYMLNGHQIPVENLHLDHVKSFTHLPQPSENYSNVSFPQPSDISRTKYGSDLHSLPTKSSWLHPNPSFETVTVRLSRQQNSHHYMMVADDVLFSLPG